MMAKKKQVVTEPTISNIPIAVSDNPMVIDLPDGQKIVLGKLNPGAVIEVATWRGTGRPDSRTNRFMLGISDSTSTPSPEAAGQSQSTKKIKFTAPWKREKMDAPVEKKREINSITRFIGGTIDSFSKALRRTRDLTPVESTTDLEINAWIQNLSREVKEESKSAFPRKVVAKKTAVKKAVSTKKAATTTKTGRK
jgi:hypothetical protein